MNLKARHNWHKVLIAHLSKKIVQFVFLRQIVSRDSDDNTNQRSHSFSWEAVFIASWTHYFRKPSARQFSLMFFLFLICERSDAHCDAALEFGQMVLFSSPRTVTVIRIVHRLNRFQTLMSSYSQKNKNCGDSYTKFSASSYSTMSKS